ncbi:uncharacterized protein B0P05DRAFT_582883 [Gilbertella persicaria]|uniref:uncharacterized protein n=1 Tax=Gilbertella persicaria TaxID=101096 RepID=UPI00221FB598|nr:uncharacterized protein B0P05DRAFT_582883 [Gilbertella persicaria]KAI8097897.1 hypothetical protein B0P05DRAFT_582883 [Gilbertella persicaria]
MNKHRHPNLPSISTLLKGPPSPPPPIIVINEEQTSSCSPKRYQLSPILSPIDSYTSSPNSSSFQSPLSPLPSPSLLSLPTQNSSLPPLQGDDPPRRLRHPSVSSVGSISSITSPKPSSFNLPLWTNMLSPISQAQKPYTHTSPPSYCSSPQQQDKGMMLSDQSRSPSPIMESLPPTTQIIMSESGQPILKRRRGRPPSLREPALEGGWTFLTPTVWDVKNNLSEEEDQEDQENLSSDPLRQRQQGQTKTPNNTDLVMNGSMAAFTSSNMDMVLQMPRKKRGRKPKTHIVGNSCFVWKDITASKRASKVAKQQKQQQQKPNLRRLEPTV